MSRYGYFLFILILIIISFLMYNQFSKSFATAEKLIKEEIRYGMALKINRFYKRNIRYPDSKLDIFEIAKSMESDERIELFKYSKGNLLKPAKITYKIKFTTDELSFSLMYYGCEYIQNRKKKGSVEII